LVLLYKQVQAFLPNTVVVDRVAAGRLREFLVIVVLAVLVSAVLLAAGLLVAVVFRAVVVFGAIAVLVVASFLLAGTFRVNAGSINVFTLLV
jgi:hypothetical protein